MSLLETVGLSVTFGGLKAVDDVNVTVEQGQLVGLIGPNGAGKTTFIDAMTGFVPSRGRIVFDGRHLEGQPAHRRSQAGLGRTWQSLELFDDLTVGENLQVAAERQSVGGFINDVFRPNRRRDLSAVDQALVSVGLAELADSFPSALSQGQRKLVSVARALAAQPRLVCMDEPAAGLDTDESQRLGQRLRDLVEGDTTIFLVDHDMGLVLSFCDYIYVIEFGLLIAEGTPSDIRANERVITAYLGESARKDVEEAKAALAAAEEAQVGGAGQQDGTRPDGGQE
jgi:branched-chain amino acid transport system ATP-binding protein